MSARNKARAKTSQVKREAGTSGAHKISGKAAGAQKALRESEAGYRTLFDQARDSILLLETAPYGIPAIRDANAAALLAYSYSREELLGKPISFLDAEAPESPIRERVSLVQPPGGAVFEARRRRKDGLAFDIEVSTIAITVGGRQMLLEMSHDITSRKRKEREILERNEELSRFTYAVSHDLRSPLVTIKTFIGYLEEQDIPGHNAAAIAKDFSFINTAADKMFKLLDELLALSRVERNINAYVEMPLRPLVEEALALVAGRISERGVKTGIIDEIATLFGVETVTLSGNRQRLLEVFQNLLDNAAKFMGEQPDPVIEAGVDLSGAEPVFFVRDNGIGLESRHAGKIFGLFEKLNPGAEGTGMGLALARRIIEAHGGRIWAESEGPGRGTTFRFTLANTKRIRGAR